MHGLVESLDDPYSEYMDEKGFARLNEMTDGTFGGIGVVLGQRNKEFVVVSPMEGSPGAKAGIEAGDKILKVNDVDTKGRTLEDVVSTIRGKKGTSVKLLLEHKNGQQFTADIVRDDIKVQSVAGRMLPDSKIGYIRIAMFNENTGEEFKKAYEKLEQEGMQATLLDLRHNPGGLLTECVKVSNYIVPKGPVVSITDKKGDTKVYESKLEKVKYPLAVLIDHGSASASEIVSANRIRCGTGYQSRQTVRGQNIRQGLCAVRVPCYDKNRAEADHRHVLYALRAFHPQGGRHAERGDRTAGKSDGGRAAE